MATAKFNSEDIVFAFQDGEYELAALDQVAEPHVPEPSSLLLLVSAGVTCLLRARRR